MAWTPLAEVATSLGGLLSQFQDPRADHAGLYAQLETFKQLPDFQCYLAFILSQERVLAPVVCQTAGLLLKTSLKDSSGGGSMSPEVESVVKESALACLHSPTKGIRGAASSIVSAIVGARGFASWPHLVERIFGAIDAAEAQPEVAAQYLNTLFKTLEDQRPDQFHGAHGRLHVEVMQMCRDFGLLDKLVARTAPPPAGATGSGANPPGAPAHSVQLEALACLYEMVPFICDGDAPSGVDGCADPWALDPVMSRGMDAYLASLFSLVYTENASVRRRVCMAFVQLVRHLPDKLEPHLGGLVAYMLSATAARDPVDQGLALEACEFWIAYVDSACLPPEHLHPVMKDLLGVLLERMMYQDDDDDVIEAESAALVTPSGSAGAGGQADVAPFRLRAATRQSNAWGCNMEDHSYDGYCDGDDDDDSAVATWNLRKCSALALDNLAATFGDDILPIVMPVIQARLVEPGWQARESATLALGAIGMGCEGLGQHTVDIANALLGQISNPNAVDGGATPQQEPQQHPLLIAITCWTLSRFVRPLAQVSIDNGAAGRKLFDSVFSSILAQMNHHHPKVQGAATSAVATFVEDVDFQLMLQVLDPTINAVSHCLGWYQGKNELLLYDTIVAVTDKVWKSESPFLLQQDQQNGTNKYDQLVLLPLVQSLLSTKDLGDVLFLNLAQSLALIVAPFGPLVEKYAPGIVQFALAALKAQMELKASQQQQQSKNYEPKCVAVVLELVCSIAQIDQTYLMKPELSATTTPELLSGLGVLCLDESPDIRQSTFSLFSSFVSAWHPHPHVQVVMPAVLSAATKTMSAFALKRGTHAPFGAGAAEVWAVNNACWLLSQVAHHFPHALDAMPVPPSEGNRSPNGAGSTSCALVRQCAPVLERTAGYPRPLVENVAILIGTLGAHDPARVALVMDHFFWSWVVALAALRDSLEKERAFAGMCAMVQANPQVGLKYFASICRAVASWYHIKNEELCRGIQQVLHGCKHMLAAKGEWDAMQAVLGQPLQAKLANEYGL